MDNIKKMAREDFWTDIECGRCGRIHPEVRFRRFGTAPANTVDGGPYKNGRFTFAKDPLHYTHWGMCPVTAEPILLVCKEPMTDTGRDVSVEPYKEVQ